VYKACLKVIADITGGTLHGSGDLVCEGIATDSRESCEGSLFAALTGPQFDGHTYIEAAKQQGAVAALVERMVDDACPQVVVPSVSEALLALSSYWRSQYAPMTFSVTGSCGKTTVRQLLESICSLAGTTHASTKSFNNHLGVPRTLLALSQDHQYYVQEIGANHAGEIQPLVQAVRPNIAIITNAAAAHLEGFGSLKGVASAKGELLSGLADNGVAILNQDDPFCSYWAGLLSGQEYLTFSVSQAADVMAKDIVLTASGCAQFRLCCSLGEVNVVLQLVGMHNVANALAAAAAACAAGLPLSVIAQGLQSACGEEGRLQSRLGPNGSLVIDDSYNANPLSVSSALQTLSHYSGQRVFIFGDMLELGDVTQSAHEAVGQLALSLGIDQVLCYGSFAKLTAQVCGSHGQWFSSQDDLVASVLPHLNDSSVVLVKGSYSMGMRFIVKALLSS